MTGFRVGYTHGPPDLMAPIAMAHQFSVACVDSPAQHAALAALANPQGFMQMMIRESDRRRGLLFLVLGRSMVSNAAHRGELSTCSLMFRVSGVSSERLAEHLARSSGVVTVPGSAFGRQGEGYIRLSYATAYEQLEQTMNRIERTVQGFRKA